MGKLSDTAKVGLSVIIAVMVLLGGYALVRGSLFGVAGMRYYIVDFENAEGISEGTPVKIAGTNVGHIETKEFLPERRVARIKFRLSEDISLYRDSIITIKQEGLLGSKYIEILDPPAELLSSANLVEEGYEFSGKGQADLLGGMLGEEGLGGLIPEEGISVNFPQFFEEQGVADQMIMLMQQLQLAVDNTNGVVLALGGMVSENKGAINETVSNVNSISQSMLSLSRTLEATSVELSAMATDPEREAKLDSIVANLDQVSMNMNHLTTEMDKLISDPTLQSDAKDSIRLLKETMEEAKKTMQGFQETLGGVNGLIGNADGALTQVRGTIGRYSSMGEGIDYKLRANVRAVDSVSNQGFDDEDRVVGDINVAVGRDSSYVELGAENIGEDNDLNLLFGLGPLDGLSFRGGIYRSELGAGFAWNLPSGNGGVSVNVYDTHDPKLNAIGRVPVGDAVNVIVGVEDINKESMATVGVGVEL